MASKDNVLFSDIFDIKDLDTGGKKFDKVSRLNARSENYEMELTLDINNELYPLEIGEKFSLILATSLSLTTSVGNDTSGTQESWREKVGGERTLADDYEYVMYGKVYKYDEGQSSKVSVYISFGGLLMCLEGDFRHLQNISLGENLYLLMRKEEPASAKPENSMPENSIPENPISESRESVSYHLEDEDESDYYSEYDENDETAETDEDDGLYR